VTAIGASAVPSTQVLKFAGTDEVAGRLKVMITFAVRGVHVPLTTLHLNVYAPNFSEPAGVRVTVAFGAFTLLNETVPPAGAVTTVQVPVPIVGVDPFNVKEVPQTGVFTPAV
jgi:hypothetical protein